MVGRRVIELNFDPVSVQSRVRLRAGERGRIDIGADDKAHTTGPCNPGEYSSTGSDIQNRLRCALPAKKIQRRRNVGRYEAKAMVDGVVIAEAEIGAMIVGE